MDNSFKDYFSTKSNDYANYRPTYPKHLAKALATRCASTELALDCGCGTGQLSVLLADFFTQVVATDASSNQIANATALDGVTYRVAAAENSGLPTASVDLVTVAQAAHWLDLDKFYTEVNRVLKPGGIVALIAYGILHVDDPACDAVVQDIYHDALGSYWPPERKHVESGYKTLAFPFDEITFPPLHMEAIWNLDELFDYLSTWSAYKEFEKADGSQQIQNFKNSLARAWGAADFCRKIYWPLSVRIGNVGDH